MVMKKVSNVLALRENKPILGSQDFHYKDVVKVTKIFDRKFISYKLNEIS